MQIKDFIADDNGLSVEEILAVDLPKEVAGPFIQMRLTRYENLRCRCSNFFKAVCVLEMTEKTTLKKIPKDQRPWFFVTSRFWQQYDIPEASWYRALKILEADDIISVRRNAGPCGRNLIAFVDQLTI